MEKVVDSLEIMFNKTDRDLDYMSRKLAYEMEHIQGVDQKINPVKLMEKMERIKSEYANIVKDASAIQAAQKEYSDYFRTSLLTLTDMLQKLEMRTGQFSEQSDETKAVFGQLSNLLGIAPGELESQVQASASGIQDSVTGGGDEKDSSPSESSSREAAGGAKSTKTSEKKSLTTAEKRKKSSEFCEITEEEFQSVSQIVRLRLKREEVNKTYQRLWQHFVEEKNTGKLSPKEMNAMGLRVTGATGEAKLKVLRSLKLCQLTKNGEVTFS